MPAMEGGSNTGDTLMVTMDTAGLEEPTPSVATKDNVTVP